MSSRLLMTVFISIVAVLVLQDGAAFSVQAFGFEKNSRHRQNADTESVTGCMRSCADMLAGWLEMSPASKNYLRQKEKIETKAQQCLSMNELADFPFNEEQILASCGLSAPHCVEVTPEQIHFGACGDISLIGELNLPQCCTQEGPGGIDCGADAEWVVGVAAFATCYVPGS